MELQVLDQNMIVTAFNTENGIQAIIDSICAQVEEKTHGVVWDFSKKKDRDHVASLARKVASSKTAIDAEGKKLKEQYTVITNKIDAERKLARDRLDAERDRIRKPLTDWEQAEKDRIQAIEDRISQFDAGRVDAFSPSELIKAVIAEVEAIAIDESFQDLAPKASIAKDAALRSYRESLELATKREVEQAELERQRIAEQERLQRERDAQIAREAAEKATRDAEEKARIEAERVQQEQLQAAQREADLIAAKQAAERREQEAKIQADQQAKQAEIDRKNAVEAERKRIEAEQLAQAEAARKAEETRLADENHRKQICNEALQGLLKLNMSEEQGKAILRAIYKGEVPHVAIKF